MNGTVDIGMYNGNWSGNYNDSGMFVSPFSVLFYRYMFIVLYSIIFAVCTVGNSLILIVTTKSPRMKTRTNFFLGNLAAADLLVGLVCLLPNLLTFLYPGWLLGQAICKIHYFTESFSLCASVLLLAVIALERYLAVMHPLRAKGLFTTYRMHVAQVIIWVMAALYNIPLLVIFDTAHYPGDMTFCFIIHEVINMRLYYTISFILWYIVPLLTMCIAYAIISYTLWHSCAIFNSSGPDTGNSTASGIHMGNPPATRPDTSSGGSSSSGGRGEGSKKEAARKPDCPCKWSRSSGDRECSVNGTGPLLGKEDAAGEAVKYPDLYKELMPPDQGAANVGGGEVRGGGLLSVRVNGRGGKSGKGGRVRWSCCVGRSKGENGGGPNGHELNLMERGDYNDDDDVFEPPGTHAHQGSNHKQKGTLGNSPSWASREAGTKDTLIPQESEQDDGVRFSLPRRAGRFSEYNEPCYSHNNGKGGSSPSNQYEMVTLNNTQTNQLTTNYTPYSCSYVNQGRKMSSGRNLVRNSIRSVRSEYVSDSTHYFTGKSGSGVELQPQRLSTSLKVIASRRKVVRLLVLVLVSFALCVLPHHVRLLMHHWDAYPTVSFGIGFFPIGSFLLLYLNSALNPVLYGLFSESFRRSVREYLRRPWQRCRSCFRHR